jgi:methyl-accepting chemotaxis protein
MFTFAPLYRIKTATSMDTRILNPATIILLISSLIIMYFMMNYLFKNSVLFKIGISTASVIILASFISSTQVKLGPIHNIWAFPLQLALAIAAYWYISRTIKQPLILLTRYIEQISSGNLKVQIEDDQISHKKDEIGSIARAMNQMQEGLKAKSVFASQIGDGNFGVSFHKLSHEDELGEALLNMQKSLSEARKKDDLRKTEDSIRNWIAEGQARFAEILRQNTADVSEFSYQIISNLVKYMGVNQGGLFIINEDKETEKFLELMGCYAFDRRKYLQKRIECGEGLVGTCYIEGQTIYIKQIPQDYIRITSGLGDENPRELLIVPLKFNEEVFGVIELASLTPFDKHHVEFAEKTGEIIASSVAALRINNTTTSLLAKSQQQAEELMAQEEEMRQNMEELSATQEAMAEKDRKNQKLIEQLTQENLNLKRMLTPKEN